MIDLNTWQALRHQSLGPAEAVDAVSQMFAAHVRALAETLACRTSRRSLVAHPVARSAARSGTAAAWRPYNLVSRYRRRQLHARGSSLNSPLGATPGVTLHVTIEIEAEGAGWMQRREGPHGPRTRPL